MSVHLNLITHEIPLWFLVLSLFLPRICMLVAFFQHSMTHYIPSTLKLLPIIVALLVPRIVILFWIYQDQGISLWFVIHLIVALMSYGGGSRRISRRRERVEYAG
jgi:hypothetical protein